MPRTFRFHMQGTPFFDCEPQPLVKRRRRKREEFTLLASDSNRIKGAFGVESIESYSGLCCKNYVTLTCREADLIALANPGRKAPAALEMIFPWLPKDITYKENVDLNFAAAKRIIDKYGDLFIVPADFCDKKWATVCNSIRRKTDADSRFYTAWHLPVQDSYILEENRPNRVVVALDFNAMYPFCMQQDFPKPSTLRHVVFNQYVCPHHSLPMGLYRCKLQGPNSDFINKYNPFRSFFAGRYLQPTLSDELLVDLNEFEVLFYQKHFSSIFIIDAVVSSQSVPHPLAREARRFFARRSHYLAHNNKVLADREKFLATLLASCTHRPDCISQLFDHAFLATDFLQTNYGISDCKDDPFGLSAEWLKKQKGFSVIEKNSVVNCVTPNIKSRHACFLFNQRIVAQGRTNLLQMMENVHKIVPDVEICYANVDSIHFSFPKDFQRFVLDWLREGSSDEMGAYKIETIASGGLWLEPGRYWLYTDQIEKFKNKSIRHNGKAFANHSFHVASRQIGDLHIPVRLRNDMVHTMTDARSIEYDPLSGLERQKLVELKPGIMSSTILSLLEQNRREHIPRRVEAFSKLEMSFEPVGSSCLGTQQNYQD